jgi:hypothetical protein
LFRTAITEFFTGKGKSLAYVGSALALTGIGTATAAAATSSSSGSTPGIASAVRHVDVGDTAGQHGSAVTTHHAREDLDRKAPAHQATDHKATASKATAKKTETHKAVPAHRAATHHSSARPATAKHATKHARVHVVRHSRAKTWQQVRDALASQTYPKAAPHTLPLADRLMTGSASGAQAYMPVTAARMANATTIVRQALSKHMGLRAAVIAVATSMQESTLDNINYGDRDSLGLFQQRPSAGWGTPAEITNPVYAADAFLNALRGHQQADPSWASQPLWENAQAVQNSGFPYAYAKWESQAAQLVSAIARHMA